MNDPSTHRHRRAAAAMIRIMWLFVLTCGIMGAADVSPRALVTSWVVAPPSCPRSSRRTSSGDGGRRKLWTARSCRASPSSSLLEFAVQDKILEGLRRKWSDGGEGQKKDSANVADKANGHDADDSQQRMRSPSSSKPLVPFVIQKIGRGKKEEIEEITRMCIDVFFNEQDDVVATNDGKKRVAPWKAMQLAYLRNFQYGDILARNAFRKDQLVDLIVARRVYPATDFTRRKGNGGDFVHDVSQIFNLEELLSANGWGGEDAAYVTGEIIGYCEVSEKNFGLGGNFDATTSKKRRIKSSEKPRPYLSNLSVVEDARRSGVGSKLMDACEEAVRDWNSGHTEIVLQVEEDNPEAIQFYKRRGWEYVFADPTCRRYDTSGFFLKETRITKYAMIKRLNAETNGDGGGGSTGASEDAGSSFIQKLRNSFFVQ